MLITIISFYLTVFTFTLQFISHPNLFYQFISSLLKQAVGINPDGSGRDVGWGLYKIFGQFLNREHALILHIIFMVFLSYITYYYLIKLKFKINNNALKKILFYTCLILLTLFNPRLKIYDFWLVSPACLIIVWTFYVNSNLF